MARPRKKVRPVVIVIKLTLQPGEHDDIIDELTKAQSKAQSVIDAYRGRAKSAKPAKPKEPDAAEAALDAAIGFIM